MDPTESCSANSASASNSADPQPFTYINPKYRLYFNIDPEQSPELRDSPPTRAIPTESTNGNQDAISECFDNTVCYEDEVGDGRNGHWFEINSGKYDLVMASLDGAAVSAPHPAQAATTAAVPSRSTVAEGVESSTEPEGGDEMQVPSIGSSTFWLQAQDNAAIPPPLGRSIMAQLFTSANGRTQLEFYCSAGILEEGSVDGGDAKSEQTD